MVSYGMIKDKDLPSSSHNNRENGRMKQSTQRRSGKSRERNADNNQRTPDRRNKEDRQRKTSRTKRRGEGERERNRMNKTATYNEFDREDNEDDPFNSTQQPPSQQFDRPGRSQRDRTPKQRTPPNVDQGNFDDIPTQQLGGGFDVPEFETKTEKTYKCPEGCGRSFQKESLQKHRKICKKVFQKKRKQFDVAGQRKTPEQLEMEACGVKPKKKSKKKKKKKVPKWKLQSSVLRNAIKAGRGEDNSNTEEAKLLRENADADMTKCEFCGRTFSDQAAKRHIPHCEKKFNANKWKNQSKKETKKDVKKKKGFKRKK